MADKLPRMWPRHLLRVTVSEQAERAWDTMGREGPDSAGWETAVYK